MSKYTTELRYICETEAGLSSSVGYNSTAEVISAAAPKIFNFNFPIFDEAYRTGLEEKIIRHFYTREIGSETYGLWKLRLEAKMNEIMPYYNELYKTTVLDFNPLYDVDYQVTGHRDGTGKDSGYSTTTESGTGTNNSETTATNSGTSQQTIAKQDYNLYSDTPQGALNGVEGETYLTNVTKTTADHDNRIETSDNGSNKLKSDSTYNNHDERITKNEKENAQDYTERVFGKRSGTSYAKLIQEFRKQLLNVDMMVISELNDLFMLIW